MTTLKMIPTPDGGYIVPETPIGGRFSIPQIDVVDHDGAWVASYIDDSGMVRTADASPGLAVMVLAHDYCNRCKGLDELPQLAIKY